MLKNRFKILCILTVLIGFSLACESLTAISQDYNQARGTAGSLATQADQIITQAKGIATQIGDSSAVGTARAIATQQGPAIIATGQAFATLAADEGYLQTVEAIVTQGSGELLPTLQAAATQYLSSVDPPDDIPVITIGEVSNLFSNQSTVSYFVNLDLPLVVNFYQSVMPVLDWTDVTGADSIREDAAVLKFFKPDRVATVNLTTNPINQQTVVFITTTSQ